MDENGYPTEEELQKIREWDLSDIDGLFEYVAPFFADHGTFQRKDHYVRISTGGWSGCEEVIAAMHESGGHLLWPVTWVMSMSGGLYVFHSRQYTETFDEWDKARRGMDDVILDAINDLFEVK